MCYPTSACKCGLTHSFIKGVTKVFKNMPSFRIGDSWSSILPLVDWKRGSDGTCENNKENSLNNFKDGLLFR